MPTPAISVLIPVYNAERYLSVCLDSILQQTFSDFEIICINDGSSDHSSEILQKYVLKDKRIHVINQINSGVAATRNRLVQEIRGKYFVFVDADDYVRPSYFQRVYEVAEKEKADLVRVLYEEYSEKDRSLMRCDQRHPKYSHLILPPNNLEERFQAGMRDTQVWGKLISTELVKRHNLYFLEGTISEDISFEILLYMLARKVLFINEYLTVYRLYVNNSITSNRSKLLLGVLTNRCFALEEIYLRNLGNEKIFDELVGKILQAIRWQRKNSWKKNFIQLEKARSVVEKYSKNCSSWKRRKYSLFSYLAYGKTSAKIIFWACLFR